MTGGERDVAGNQQRAAEVLGFRDLEQAKTYARDDTERIAAALDAAVERGRAEGRAEIAAKVEALHVPWYEINGVRHDNLVTISCDQHTCAGDNDSECSEAAETGYHEVLGCSECRYVSEWDVEGYLLWPCPTIKALAAVAAPAGQDEEARRG